MTKSPQAPSEPILAIDSSWDSATISASLYREEHVYPHFVTRRLGVRRLAGAMALRVYFRESALKKEVRVITGMGHGSEPVFTGDCGEALLEVGSYDPKEVKGKIIHLLSCKTAGKLGPDLIKKGALAFFGYSKNFTFRVGLEAVFFQCDSEIDRALADGLKAAEVHVRVAAVFEDCIDQLVSQDVYAAELLTADLRYFCSPATSKLFGNPNAKLRTP